MKKYRYLCGAAGAVLMVNGVGHAQPGQPDSEGQFAAGDRTITLVERKREEGILVNATRTREEVFAESYTGSATVIESRILDQRQTREIADVLRDVPGIAVNTIAGQTQIRLRGAEANHVLVLIDGIEVSDPGSGEFDIGTLQAEIGARVEVLRGPQSALYGNDALSGVVAYDSASGRDRRGFSAFLEGGTNATVNGAARFGASGDDWDAAFSATLVSTDGEPNTRSGLRDIGRDSYTVSGKGSVDLADGFTLRVVGRYVLTEGQFNDQDFGFGSPTFGLVIDSPGVRFENEAIFALMGAHYEALDGAWTHDLSAQIADSNRSTSDAAGRTSDTQSDRFKASYVTAYQFGGREHTLTFATDYELEGFNNVATFNDRNELENAGFVSEYRYSGAEFDLAAALRHDLNDRFEDATTFLVGAGFQVTDTTRLRAAAGSGIKNPTLTELFGFFDGVFVGNPDLVPEESLSWEVGIDQSFANGSARGSVTYFNAELKNEIFVAFPPPDFIQTPGNRSTASTQQGIEVALAADLGNGLIFDGAYTFLDAEEDGIEEVRRPAHIASAVLNWTAPGDAASVNLAVRYNGEARDSDFSVGSFPAPLTTLDDYTLITLNARLRLTEEVSAFGRVENLLDERFEQVFSFVSPGRGAIVGVEARF